MYIENVMNNEQALSAIRQKYNGYPKEAIDYIVENYDDIKPLLLQEIENAIDNKLDISGDSVGYISAMHILGDKTDADFFPLYVRILKLPKNEVSDLLGGILSDEQFLYYCFDGNAQSLYELIETAESIDSRIGALIALKSLIQADKIERRPLVLFLEKILDDVPKLNYGMWGSIFYVIAHLEIDSLYSRCLEVVGKGLIDYEEITVESFNEMVENPEDEDLRPPTPRDLLVLEDDLKFFYTTPQELQKQLKELRDEHIELAIAFMTLKKAFESNLDNKGVFINDNIQVKKLPVNSPCSCGSGKKYKKCCMNR